jgi:hypothetical protein
MNAGINDVYRMLNGRLIYMQKYCPKRWFHWHVSTVVFLCVAFYVAGIITWVVCMNIFVPIPTCDYPHTIQELRALR